MKIADWRKAEDVRTKEWRQACKNCNHTERHHRWSMNDHPNSKDWKRRHCWVHYCSCPRFFD